jgi:hypothetical protein
MTDEEKAKAYVVLEHRMGADKGYRFWSMNQGDTRKNECGTDEEPWYKEVGFTDSDEEAINMCHEHYSKEAGLMHFYAQYPPELLALITDSDICSKTVQAIQSLAEAPPEVMEKLVQVSELTI